jgi:LPS-assembly lipoprotein
MSAKNVVPAKGLPSTRSGAGIQMGPRLRGDGEHSRAGVRLALLAACALALAACGFQLRGAAELPFETLYVPATAGIGLDIKRSIRTGSSTQVVDDPKAAQAVLEFTQETREKIILSITSAGRVNEFELRYRVGFRVHDGKGGEFLPASTLQLARAITFNDSIILAKEAEEQQLYRDMQFDMLQLIMRRLAAAQKPKPTP